MAAPTIVRTADTDDDGTNTTGTVHNNAWKTAIYDAIDTVIAALYALVASVTGVSTITTTGTITALALPTGTGDLVIRLNNASLTTIQGIVAGTDGQQLTLVSLGAGQVDLANQNASATAANRLINQVTGTISLAAGVGRVILRYDVTTARWRVIVHEQGAWITPAFAAGNFTASTGTWTVSSGNVANYSYFLRGTTLSVSWVINATSVSATPAVLSIAIPASLVATRTTYNVMMYIDNNSANTAGQMSASASGTTIDLQKMAGSWSTAASLTYQYGQHTFQVN